MIVVTLEDGEDVEYTDIFSILQMYEWNMNKGRVRKWEYRFTLTVL